MAYDERLAERIRHLFGERRLVLEFREAPARQLLQRVRWDQRDKCPPST
jgi:hypothetical protein